MCVGWDGVEEMSSRPPPALEFSGCVSEGPGAAQSWEAPDNLPEKSMIKVSPEAKGACPTCLLECIFELWYFPDFPYHLAYSTNGNHQSEEYCVVLRLGFNLER